jgi:hypothetical protein
MEYILLKILVKYLIPNPEEGHKNIFQIEDNSFWFKHRNNYIIEVINNFPPPGIILGVGGEVMDLYL